MNVTEPLVFALSVWAILATLAWFNERHRVRDCWTDLSQLIHDGDATEDDLRRTLDHEPIRKALDRRGGE